MKQIIEKYRTGELELVEVPIPVSTPNTLLIKNVDSLIRAQCCVLVRSMGHGSRAIIQGF
jgi:hypothetical protein